MMSTFSLLHLAHRCAMLSGYGNLDNLNNQCKDPMKNNKDCRVGQLTRKNSPLQFRCLIKVVRQVLVKDYSCHPYNVLRGNQTDRQKSTNDNNCYHDHILMWSRNFQLSPDPIFADNWLFMFCKTAKGKLKPRCMFWLDSMETGGLLRWQYWPNFVKSLKQGLFQPFT